jgi:hypothetical protein
MTRTISIAALLVLVGCGPEPDSPTQIGKRKDRYGYHVRAGVPAQRVPGGLGFVITADGQGGYQITWTTTVADSGKHTFIAEVTSDGAFDPSSVVPMSGREHVQVLDGARRLWVTSQPGSDHPDGFAFVSSEPIYVMVLVDGGQRFIFFTGAETGRLMMSNYSPVAFTSP